MGEGGNAPGVVGVAVASVGAVTLLSELLVGLTPVQEREGPPEEVRGATEVGVVLLGAATKPPALGAPSGVLGLAVTKAVGPEVLMERFPDEDDECMSGETGAVLGDEDEEWVAAETGAA